MTLHDIEEHHSGPAIIYQQEIVSQATDKSRILTGSAWLFQPTSRTFENIPTICYGNINSEWVPPINKLVFLPYLALYNTSNGRYGAQYKYHESHAWTSNPPASVDTLFKIAKAQFKAAGHGPVTSTKPASIQRAKDALMKSNRKNVIRMYGTINIIKIHTAPEDAVRMVCPVHFKVFNNQVCPMCGSSRAVPRFMIKAAVTDCAGDAYTVQFFESAEQLLLTTVGEFMKLSDDDMAAVFDMLEGVLKVSFQVHKSGFITIKKIYDDDA